MISTLLTPSHVAILLVALLLIFGPKRLPETGRALGKGMREFKDGLMGRDGRPARAAGVPPGAEPEDQSRDATAEDEA
jgi:sec-independent protein translocase protein TatA